MTELTVEELIAADPSANDSGLPAHEHLTDLGNARRLVHRDGELLRYCATWGSWLVWDGGRWRRDDTGEVERRAKSTVAAIYSEAERCQDPDERKLIGKHAIRSEGLSKLRAMVEAASTEAAIAIRPGDLDADPLALSCANGTVDLRSGALREPDPRELLSRGSDVAYDPDAACPRWERFLGEVFDGDSDLIAFFQRLVGLPGTFHR